MSIFEYQGRRYITEGKKARLLVLEPVGFVYYVDGKQCSRAIFDINESKRGTADYKSSAFRTDYEEKPQELMDDPRTPPKGA